jgi:hypothetical protein
VTWTCDVLFFAGSKISMAAATRGRSGAATGFGRGGWGSDAVEGGRRQGSCEVQVNGFWIRDLGLDFWILVEYSRRWFQ